MRVAIILISTVLLAISPAASLVPPPSLNSMVHKADLIVTGELKIIEAARERFVIGKDGTAANLVVTYVEVVPREFLKGSADERILIRLLGGMMDGYAIIDADAPSIKHQETAVVFLRESRHPRQSTNEKVYLLAYDKYGKFSVDAREEGDVVWQSVRNPILGLSVSEEDALDYEEFRNLIELEKQKRDENDQRTPRACSTCGGE